MPAPRPETVDDYIASFPPDVRATLEELRRTVHAAVPGAGERISYRIPTFTLNGKAIVHVAAWTHHVSLYPVPDTDGATEQDLAPFRAGRGTVKFPLDQPVPYFLVTRLVELLVEQRH